MKKIYSRFSPNLSSGLNVSTSIRAGTIWAAPFDLDRLEVTGSAVPVLDGVLLDCFSHTVQLTFSDDGTLIYAPGGDTHRVRPVWIDRQGNTDLARVR